MSNIARLALFFSVFFIISFALAGVFEYIRLAVDAAAAIPAAPPAQLGQFSGELRKIVPLILYCAILMGLSYSARRGIALPAAILSIFILAGGAALGLSLGLRNLGAGSVDAPLRSGGETKTLGGPGLILSRWDVTVALLGDPGKGEGSRVISIPGRPLIYQETPSGPDNAVVLFRDGDSPLIRGLLVDSALVAEQFETRLNRGLLPFALYGGAIILLLSSLRFVLDLSSWPLANLFCGALAFRGILAFQTFLDSRDVQAFIIAFFDRRIDGAIISPVIFTGLALLILLYTFLASLAKSESRIRAPRQGRLRQRLRRRQPNG
ncbi:MAG: hypothetical protein LBG14_06680 [Treponema sp.]|jgi:hypothetical protein|nr:hypothetical protein [Treponema sp.]